MVVIGDAIDVEQFNRPVDAASRNDFRARYGISLNQKIVAYIGRVRHEKGWMDLPGIAQGLAKADALLLIVGDGPDRVQLEQALERAGVNSASTITGFLEPDEVKIALAVADVLILPSRTEAFGSVLLEAMASSVAAVAYTVEGAVEVAGEPRAIQLVQAGDRRAFTQAVLDLLVNPGERRRLTERGRRRVLDFSLAATAAQTLSCYRRILGSTGTDRSESNLPLG